MPIDPNGVTWDDSPGLGVKWDDKPDEGILKNLALGALKGATDIGTTLLRPVDAVLNATGITDTSNADRRAALKQFYEQNANPDSLAFKGGEIGTGIAGTAGVGGVLAKGASLIPQLAKFAPALETGGFSLGDAAATGANQLLKNTATRVGAGAITGGATAGLVDPSSIPAGAVIGGALPPAVKAAGAVGNSIFQNIKAPIQMLTDKGQRTIAAQTALNAAGENADDIIQRLKTAQGLVPGELPTVAEVAESPGLAAMQRAMSSADPEGYGHRFIANSDAREAALRAIAQDEAARAAATKARDSTSKSLYAKAFNDDAARMAVEAQAQRETATAARQRAESIAWNNLDTGVVQKPANALPTSGLQSLSERPAFRDAMAMARESMDNAGVDVPLNSLEGLHRVKQALDSALNGSAPNSALSRYDRRSLMDMKSQLIAELKNLSPTYDAARQSYANLSKPINQMDVGQYLLEKLKPASTDYGKLTGERANAFLQAVRDADQTAKNALGTKAAGGLKDILTTEQMATIDNVAKSLARVGNANDLGRGVGSNTYQNLAMDKLAGQAGMPSIFDFAGPAGSIAGRIIKAMNHSAEPEVKSKLAQLLLDPQAAALAMEGAQKEAARKALHSNILNQYLLENPSLRTGVLMTNQAIQ